MPTSTFRASDTPASDDRAVLVVVVAATAPAALAAWLGGGSIGGGATLCGLAAALGSLGLVRAAVRARWPRAVPRAIARRPR